MNQQMQRSVYGLVSTIALSALLGSRVCAQGTETPKTANRFCDSIGVNTHLGSPGTPYTTNSSGGTGSPQDFYNNVQLPLAWLGVRHIRDYMSVDDFGADNDNTVNNGKPINPGYLAISNSNYPAANDTEDDYFNRLRRLGNQGVKCDLTTYPVGWAWVPGQMVPESSAITNTFLLGCQEAMEGANEWDLFSVIQANDPSYDWQPSFASETSDIWSYYRGSSSTAGIQIYSGTLVDLSIVNGMSVASNDWAASPNTASYVSNHGIVSGQVDYGNCHNYNWSKVPNNPEGNMNASIFGPVSKGSDTSQLWGSTGPFVITETGYFTGTDTGSVTPLVQEKYTLRTLFTAFNLGAYRTYLFELYDLGSDGSKHDQNFGLIYNNLTNKPAYTALECLTGLLSDSSTSTAVTPLTWTLGGTTADVNHTLLQKSDGSYYLALWLGKASTDSTLSQSVTVSVPSTVAAGTLYTINQYGSMSSGPVTITKGKMSFKVTDSVSVLKLTGPVVESTPLALSQTTVSRNGGVVTASVTFQNVSATAMTILPYIAARDGSGNNVDFGSGGKSNVTLSPGQTVSVSVTKTLATWMNTGTWSVSASYQTPSDGHWYGLSPTLPLTVTN